MHFPLLSILIWLPILTAGLVLLIGNDERAGTMRIITLVSMLISMAVCIPLYTQFDFSTSAMQFNEMLPWLPALGIEYRLGIDGIAMPLIVLTTFTTIVTLFATWYSIEKKVSQYLAAFLVMQGLIVGVFSSLNAILFYMFFEATLVPMYLIIGIWGSANRVYAAIKFFLYTFLGSVMMLIAVLYLGMKANTFDILAFYPLSLGKIPQLFLFVAFLLGFAIKVPMWPVHTWLPDAHTEAPAGGSIMLAAVLLKMGVYGFLRFSLPIVPDACKIMAPFMVTLSLIAIVYIALVAIVQKDMKKLVAYSSISHMGFATLGCFIMYSIFQHAAVNDAGLALEGAMFVLISHAFISGAMFAGIGFIYDRMHTREIADFGGVVNSMPVFASFFLLFALANAGMPGTSGFVGEFMVIVGVMKANFWVSFWSATTLIFGAGYTLWMYKRVFWGAIANDNVAALQDIRGYELLAFVLMAGLVLGFGIFPGPLLNVFHATAQHVLVLSNVSKF